VEYMECEVPRQEGYCLDNDCPCPPARLNRGEGYLYISQDLIAFRKDCLSRSELQRKLAPRIEGGEYISVTAYEPTLMCEQAAHSRNLDMPAAAEDARRWWNEGVAPLRPTPKAGGGFAPQESPGAAPAVAAAPDASFEEPPVETPPTANAHESFAAAEPVAAGPDDDTDVGEGVSTSDVMEQYADSPLAELAEKMAHAEHSAEQPASSASDTVTGPATSLGWPDREPENTVVGDSTPRRDSRQKSGNGWMIVAVLSGLVVAGGGVLALLLVSGRLDLALGRTDEKPARMNVVASVEEYRPDQSTAEPAQGEEVEVATAPPRPESIDEHPAADARAAAEPDNQPSQSAQQSSEQPQSRPDLTASFFGRAYAFRDSKYSGEIRYNAVNDGRGAYEQQVKLPGTDRVVTVTGIFTFNADRIVYQPEGAQTEVVWSLERWSPDQGAAVFYDPRQERESSRVYLTAKN
jgi:hypothetical protein